MNAKELIEKLQQLPQNANIYALDWAHIHDLDLKVEIEIQTSTDLRKKELPQTSCSVSFSPMMNSTKQKIFIEGNIKEIELAWCKISKWFKKKESNKEKLIDLCPDCKVYCEKRFVDGRCE